jgi:hypothetical protein
MELDLHTEVRPERHQHNLNVEREIARQYIRDLQQWYALHRNELICCNGSSSEFKLD